MRDGNGRLEKAKIIEWTGQPQPFSLRRENPEREVIGFGRVARGDYVFVDSCDLDDPVRAVDGRASRTGSGGSKGSLGRTALIGRSETM